MRPRVVVVGSLNADLTLRVPQLPLPGETVLADGPTIRTGGKGANQAIAAARLGAAVTMFGAVGADAYGELLRNTLAKEGVDHRHLGTVASASGLAVIAVDANAENTILVAPGANAALGTAALADLPDVLDTQSSLLLQLEIPLPTAISAARTARAAGARVFLNAAPLADPRHPDLTNLLTLVDVLIVNETEARALGAAQADAAAADELRSVGPRHVVITLGADGAVFAGPERTGHVPSVKVVPVDTVGAGDSFCAELVVALAHGEELGSAVRRANVAGALATLHEGSTSATPRRSDVDRRLAEVTAPGRA